MKKLYCLRDERAELWYPPFPATNDHDATRAFGQVLSQRESLPAQHPQDFALYHVGEFDESETEAPVMGGLVTLVFRGDALLRFMDELRGAREHLADPAQLEVL